MGSTRQAVLSTYRQIMRSLQQYPSVKREKMIAEARLEYKLNKSVTDPAKMEELQRAAEENLSFLQKYAKVKQEGGEWNYTLGSFK
mmetsp:Transcript_7474/g.19297  ORF Transcript_7474/g.19297 Transcript_7474/m.19297 type:complete len:86 (+) Transcript_7474:111-368(+)